MLNTRKSLLLVHLSLAVTLVTMWGAGTVRAEEKPGDRPKGVELSGVRVIQDIPYKTGDALSEYEKERCKLDLYLPVGEAKNVPVVVWFHGGGITAGQKAGEETVKVVATWAKAGVAVASVNYRLSPKVTFPAYVEDAAAAVAWVKRNIASRGGDPQRVFVGGHSAGAYLSMMVGMDPQYLKAVGLGFADIAGLIPVSGQTMTHFTVRVERGLPKDDVIADEAAPIHFASKDVPPMLLLMGGKDWPARLEENQYFAAILKTRKHEHTSLLMIPDRNHGSIFRKLAEAEEPGREAILRFISDPKAFVLNPES